jgi:hypothetical protein
MRLRRLRLFAAHLWNIWIWQIVPHLAHMLSPPRNPIQAVFSWPEQKPELGPRVALFVHFDGRGNVRPYVLGYLEALRAAGMSVVFVSNTGKLKPEAIESLKPLCAGILVRRNVGYDFAAMREGLSHFGLPRANTEMLVIANDSVYGPLRPLNELLDKVDFEKADFWGATESWQSRYHLQSYFLVAGPALLAHPAWSSFWESVMSVPSKRWVITRYEVGITQWMIRQGIRCAAVFRYHDLVHDIDPTLLVRNDKIDPQEIDPVLIMRRRHARRIRNCYVGRTALNPTSDLWRQLLLAGFPFIKRELLRDNPTSVPDVMEWREVVAQTSGADISTIERDLQLVVRNSAP